jgi:hypothetical protein
MGTSVSLFGLWFLLLDYPPQNLWYILYALCSHFYEVMIFDLTLVTLEHASADQEMHVPATVWRAY